MIAKNRFTKYILYAIGEIILVVIGILIALSINNYSEYRKAISNENEILKSLRKEIKENIKLLERTEKLNDSFYRSGTEILLKIEKGEREFTTQEMSESFNYTTGIVDSPVLDVIVATDSDILVKNKELIEDFRDLQYSYGRIKKSEFYLDEFWNSKITDFFVSAGLKFEGFSDEDPLISLEEINMGGYSAKQFMALLSMKMDLQNYWNNRRKIGEEQSRAVLKLIE